MRRAMFALLTALAVGLAVPGSAFAVRGDLVLGVVLEPPHLDPTAGAAAAIDEVVYANLFEGLTRIDRHGAVVPALAESWEVSDDGRRYRFKLRQGVVFHDGSSFEAGDVVFSFERAMADDSVNAQKGLFEAIESVTATGPYEVEVHLKRPSGGFTFDLGWGDAVIVAPESAQTNKSRPTGTGPFRFKHWAQGERIELERFDGYWGSAPALQKVTFKLIPDPAAAVVAMLAGDIDAFPNFPAPEALARLESDARFTVVIGTTEGETIVSINNARPPFDDRRVRRAIAHALDRQAIVLGAMFGYGTPIGSHFAPHHPAYVDLVARYGHDPDMARALLSEAGYAQGFKATLRLPPPSYARRGGEIVAAQLAEVGIELEIIPIEWAQWLEQVFRGKDYDLTIVSHTEPMDIGIYGRDGYYFNYESQAFRDLMEGLKLASDDEARYRLLGQAQRLLAEDAVNGFLFQLAKHGVWDAKLKGLWENSPIQANDLTDVYWEP